MDPNDPPPSAPPPTHAPPHGAGWLILGLFLASLGVGFGAILAFYFLMRAQADVWPPPGTPALPPALWLSTAILLASSGTMHRAVLSLRRACLGPFRAWLLATCALAIAFLISQVANWFLAVAAQLPPGRNMYATTFYLMTGLHGLHVLGGLVPLGWVTHRAFRGAYTPERFQGLKYCAVYWHFVDVVWLVMFGILLLT